VDASDKADWQAIHAAHRGKSYEMARYLAAMASCEFTAYAMEGNACMAKSKRMQERYWKRRMIRAQIEEQTIEEKWSAQHLL
jgi:hypothetical protein